MPIIRRRVVVSGRVQGVFYRDTARREATKRKVTGWARNLDDGRVELVLEGEESAVDAMVSWAGGGPPRARVDDVEVTEEEVADVKGFAVR